MCSKRPTISSRRLFKKSIWFNRFLSVSVSSSAPRGSGDDSEGSDDEARSSTDDAGDVCAEERRGHRRRHDAHAKVGRAHVGIGFLCANMQQSRMEKATLHVQANATLLTSRQQVVEREMLDGWRAWEMDGRGRKSSLRIFSHPAPESSFKFPFV